MADCVICGDPIDVQLNGWTGGHNAQPVADGQCCSDCNTTYVLPERLSALLRKDS